ARAEGRCATSATSVSASRRPPRPGSRSVTSSSATRSASCSNGSCADRIDGTMVKQAVVLVGGLRTGLGAATRLTPEPVLEVGGVPFLDPALWNLARHGIRRILLLTGHLAPAFAARYGDGRAHGVHVEYSVEPESLGTGGTLALAADRVDERFLLLNGDT